MCSDLFPRLGEKMTAPQNVPGCGMEVVSLLGGMETTPVSTVHYAGENAPLVPQHHQKISGHCLGPG